MTATLDGHAGHGRSAEAPGERWVVFFGEDWGGHNSTGQYLATELARRRPVLWVNSLGLRSPGLNARDLRRIAARLRSFIGSLRGSAVNSGAPVTPDGGSSVVVASPLALPWPRYRLVRWINRQLVGAYLRREARRRGIVQPIVITACLAAVDVVDVFRPVRVIYYCADEHAFFPGMDRALVERLEGELLARADRVVASSRALVARKGCHHSDVRYLPHGVSWAHMHTALEQPPLPAGLVDIGRPIAGFVGQIGDHVDLPLLAAVAAALPQVQFVLIGPAADPTLALPTADNLHYLGARAHAELPSYLARFDVALMPFADTPRVRYAHPTKVREYLAAGCPVVATPHPELAGLSPHVATAASAAAFASAIRRFIEQPPDRSALSRSIVGHDWSDRAAAFEQLVTET